MALLKCCKEKHWFATSLIHCWFERNLHSRQTRGRSGLSLAGWLDASSLSSRRSLGPAAVLLFMQNKPPKKQIRIETLGASSVWCCLILAHSLTRSWFHLSACYSLHTGTPHFLPFLLLFSLSLLDRLAAVLSGTVLVTEDMLTSGDRYRLPNRSICSGAVRERVHGHLDTSSGVWAKCLALRTDTRRGCCRSFHCALEGVSSRCTGMWVHSRARVRFRYQFMGDYMDSFHSYFSLWIFYHHINKTQFQGCYAHGRERGSAPSTEIICRD